jgi:hypothetical protein
MPKQTRVGPRKARTPAEPKYPRVCGNAACGRSFLAKLPGTQFCGDTCRNKVHNRRNCERKRDRSPRKCGFCEVEFAPAYGEQRSKYCSPDCLKKYGYRVTNGTTHRRRARKFGCDYEKVDKIAVFERDGWRCKICGIKTPRSKMGRRVEGAPELGHIVSLCDGGPHSYSNTQCECYPCNRAKGSRSFGQLLLVG